MSDEHVLLAIAALFSIVAVFGAYHLGYAAGRRDEINRVANLVFSIKRAMKESP